MPSGAGFDLRHLPCLHNVLVESMRLHPLAWLLSRVTTTPADLAGYPLPAGSDVLVSPYALHRDPQVYSDPERFDPDRWLPDRVTAARREAFLGFGVGHPGSCLMTPIPRLVPAARPGAISRAGRGASSRAPQPRAAEV